MRIQHILEITLYQHYFPTDGEGSFGEKQGESWGEDN